MLKLAQENNMALSKAKAMANGSSGNYWKITSCQVDKTKMSVTWVITLYATQALATAGAPSLGLSYSFKSTVTKAQLATDLTQLGYVTIMAQVAAKAPATAIYTPKQAWTDLTGATNVLETGQTA
jgi:hypothetical protein